jgi:hypothetical protein
VLFLRFVRTGLKKCCRVSENSHHAGLQDSASKSASVSFTSYSLTVNMLVLLMIANTNGRTCGDDNQNRIR